MANKRTISLQEAEKEFTKGAKINWQQFRLNLAAHAASTNNPSQRLDAIMWLGIAGHPDAPLMAKPTKITHDTTDAWNLPDNAEGAFSQGMGILINKSMYPDLNVGGGTGENISEALGHEFRHRGFRIIGDIDVLLSRFPSEYQKPIKSPKSGTSINDAEHSMIYAMDGISVDDGRPEADNEATDTRFWQREYVKCNKIVRQWLKDQPIPKGAPEELRQELERIYGVNVEFVKPGETPVTPPDQIKPDVKPSKPKPAPKPDKPKPAPKPDKPKPSPKPETDETIVIVVPPRVADQAEKPDLSPISTTRDNTLARQSSTVKGKEDTKLLQKALNFLGADPKLDVDGKYGPMTRQAVKDFQKQHGLTVDGLAGPETLGKIRDLLGQKKPSKPATGPDGNPAVGTGRDLNKPKPNKPIKPVSATDFTDRKKGFLPYKDKLRKAGYMVSSSGKYVRTVDGATVAGIGKHGMFWFSNRQVRNIVRGIDPKTPSGQDPEGQNPQDNLYIDN